MTGSSAEDSSPISSNSLDDDNDLIEQLIQEHNNGELFKILAIIPKFRDTSISLVHFVFGLTLFKLGRVNGALREVALAAEIESNLEVRSMYIKSLMKLFKKLGMINEAVSCFGEIIEMKSVSEDLNPEQRAILDGLTEDKGKVRHVLPLHEQAIEYSRTADLPTVSLSLKCLTMHQDLEVSLNAVNCSQVDGTTLFQIFHCILLVGPNYLFREVLKNENILIKLMDQEIINFPEIDYKMKPKILVSQLKIWSSKSATPQSYIRSICDTVVKHKIIKGYLSFLKLEYEQAIDEFEWVSRFVPKVRSKLELTKETPYLSNITERVALMYACNSYTLMESSNAKRLTETLSKLIYSTYSFKKEYSTGRLGSFFVFCGKAYEQFSRTKGSWITISKDAEERVKHENTPDGFDKAYKYETDAVFEMIRKYILASTSFLSDDSSVLQIYDRILWGILVHGGLHSNCLWFFTTLRNHYQLEMDYGPLCTSKDHDLRLFEQEDILGKYENGWDLIFEAWELEKQVHMGHTGLPDSQKQELLDLDNPERARNKANGIYDLWDIAHSNKYLLPQIYEQKSTLLMVEDTFDGGLTECFALSSKYSVRPLLRSCLNKFKGARIFEENIGKSKELIRLWLQSSRDIRGGWPDIVESWAGVMEE